jgi:O-6-methylguanine DNA methyltransferase
MSIDGTASDDVVTLGRLDTPLGAFGAAFSPTGIGRLTFPAEPLATCEAWTARWMPEARRIEDPRRLRQLAEELTAYFEGDLRKFDVPVDLRGTPFQVQVWRALLDIQYGEVRSYAAVATEIRRPSAVRAVGAANGSNPVPIVVPCHRVIGSGGTLTGYGGGLDLKRRLLELEGSLGRIAADRRQTALF